MLSFILTAICYALIGLALLWAVATLLAPVGLWVLFADWSRPRNAELQEAEALLAEAEAELRAATPSVHHPLSNI